ncbi:MAG: DUF1800 domain-containing protein [Pseudomonadota bacterium]
MTVNRSTIAQIRFGYGFHPAHSAPRGPEDVLDQAYQGSRTKLFFPITDLQGRRNLLEKMIERRKAKDMEGRKKIIRQMRQGAISDISGRVFQRALSQHGFYERLAAFWADHFSVSGRNPGQVYMLPTFEIDVIRPHIMGRFEDMLAAVVQHPAMLHYLDQVESFGPASRAGKLRDRGLNENLAREVLELHTLGVGGPYSQEDVRQFAELLTGYGVQRGYLRFRFFPQRAEPGVETVMGKTYGGDPAKVSHALELLRDLARHRVTADHMARKLAVHFVADDPDPDLVRHIAEAWRRSGGNLPQVYQALVEHKASWRGFGAKIKRPQELMISTLRAMGANKAQAKRAMQPGRPSRQVFLTLKALNQPMFQAPGPDGWPEEAEAWITPQGLAARLQYAGKAGHQIAETTDIDPRRFAEDALQDALRPDTAFAVSAAPDRWEGFAFALASPEFNRR